ncbi:MAG: hypothetical protein K2J01_04625 [Clostridiales bacterium]|nr:hypothetical protein [Clostridiales bacterium]
MKIVFLDIDGVLNSREYDRTRDKSKLTNIDETRIPFVKQIVEQTGAVIVLSSTWRTHWNSDKNKCDEDGLYIIDLFGKYGVEIYDKTPDLGFYADRPDEIKQYLLELGEKVESFVIIDDYLYGWGDLSDRFVRTDPYRSLGIDADTVAQAVKILNNQ